MVTAISRRNRVLLELEELCIDPIYRDILSSPRLLGQHTFSTSSLNNLQKFVDPKGSIYILNPFTRAKHYIESIKKLPKNHMIANLLVLCCYGNKITLADGEFKDLTCYLIELLLIEQKKLILNNETTFIQSEYFFTFEHQLEDILFKNIIEFLGITKEVQTILLAKDVTKLANVYPKPDEIHLNNILFLAIKCNNQHLAKLLLKNIQVDLRLKDPKGKTLFFWACYHRQYEIAQALMNLGAELFSTKYNDNLSLYLKYSRRIAKFIMNLRGGWLNYNYLYSDLGNANTTTLFHYHSKGINTKELTPKSGIYEWHLVVYERGKIRLNYL